MAIRNAPCGWEPDVSICPDGPCCPDQSALPEETVQAIKDMSAMLLWALTGRRFGPCEVTVRPCKPDECNLSLSDIIYWDRGMRGLGNLGVSTVGPIPILDDGRVFNISCGCTDVCGCTADCEVFLPGPVAEITEVMVDGVVVDEQYYTVYDHSKLVFLPPFPCPGKQDYNVAPGMVGSWTVTYTIGEPLPPGANLMSGLYACELAKSFVPGGNCGLPAYVQSLARQGINIELPDPLALAVNGLTGLPVVDLFIKSLNPGRLASRSRVWSPDLPIVRRQT